MTDINFNDLYIFLELLFIKISLLSLSLLSSKVCVRKTRV